MDKIGEVRVHITRCDCCSAPISAITADGRALCGHCAAEQARLTKEAQQKSLPLKSAAGQLVSDYK